MPSFSEARPRRCRTTWEADLQDARSQFVPWICWDVRNASESLLQFRKKIPWTQNLDVQRSGRFRPHFRTRTLAQLPLPLQVRLPKNSRRFGGSPEAMAELEQGEEVADTAQPNCLIPPSRRQRIQTLQHVVQNRRRVLDHHHVVSRSQSVIEQRIHSPCLMAELHPHFGHICTRRSH